MPKVGIEPTLPGGNRILSPARLPVPPLRLVGIVARAFEQRTDPFTLANCNVDHAENEAGMVVSRAFERFGAACAGSRSRSAAVGDVVRMAAGRVLPNGRIKPFSQLSRCWKVRFTNGSHKAAAVR